MTVDYNAGKYYKKLNYGGSKFWTKSQLYENQKVMEYRQNRGGYSQNNQQAKKRSGAKMRSAKNGNMVVVAWKATKFGMLSILVAPTKYTKEVKSKSGRIWSTGMSVSIVNKNTGETSFHFGMMEKATGKTIVKNIGWVINPNGGYGGVVAKIGGRPRR